MKFDEVMTALEQAGSEQTSKTYRRHGAKDPMFGVNCAVQIKLAKPLRAAQYRAKWIDLKHEWQCGAGWRLAAARRIGKVMVDHGDTSCKTPDAESYIIKCVEHRAKQASKRAEKRVAKC